MKTFRFIVIDEENVMRPKTTGSKGMSEARKCSRFMSSKKNRIPRSGGIGHSHSTSLKQRCYLNFKYRTGAGRLAKYLKYIQKEGKGHDGTTPTIYGNFPQDLTQADDLQFRVILSPENQKTDLHVLTTTFMSQLELSTGYNLLWVAAEHYDTPKQHVHISINGRDKRGKPVRFDKNHIRHLFRSYAEDICTILNGNRTQDEINESFSKMCLSCRCTPLDKNIKAISSISPLSRDVLSRYSRGSLFQARLQYLCDLGLASYDSLKETFTVQKNYLETLSLYGKYSSYREAFNSMGVLPSQFSLHDPRKDGTIAGQVVRRYFLQDSSTFHAVVLKVSETNYAYVPLKFPPSSIQNGQEVTIQYSPTGGISEKGMVSILPGRKQ